MSEIKPVDDDKVFYQAKHKTAEIWQACSKEDYVDFEQMSWMDIRILWTSESVLEKLAATFKKHAAAYEALQKENERLKEESQNYENASRITHDWSMQIGLANGELREANAEQAKRIAELEAAAAHLGLTPQQAKDGLARHKAQVAEIEALRKQVEEIKELCAKEAEHWQTISTNQGHACGQYIAAAIRGFEIVSKNGDSK